MRIENKVGEAYRKGYEETDSPTLDRKESAMLAQTQPPMPTKPADIYDVHRQAVMDYHIACRQFEQAEARRNERKAELDQISRDLADHLQIMCQDPTNIKLEAPRPMNGQAQAGAQIQGRAVPGYAGR